MIVALAVVIEDAAVGVPASVAIRVDNEGSGPLTVSSIELVSGPGLTLDGFAVDSDGCSGRELMPGDGCEVSIRCRPWFDGGFGGRYKIVYADETFSDTGFLGCYTPTGLAIVDYDGPQSWPVNIGEQAQRRVTITNKGPVPLAIESLGFSTFSIVDVIDTNCEDALLPFGHFCFMDLWVSPPEEHSYSWLGFIGTNSFYRPNRALSLSVQGLDPARRSRADGSGRSR